MLTEMGTQEGSSVIELKIDLGTAEDQARDLAELLQEAAEDGLGPALERRLTTVRAAFTRLKHAISDAFAPLVNVAAPALSNAMNAVSRFAGDVGALFAGLFGGVVRQTKETVRTGGAALRRYLADFDELNRLGSASGGSSTVTTVTEILPAEIPEHIQKIVDQIMLYLKPLREIDFGPAREAFRKLKEAIEPIGRALFEGLEWVWFNILTPMAAWGAEQLLPAFLETLTAALEALNSLIEAAKPALKWLWEELLLPMAQWTGEKLLQSLGWLTDKLRGFSDWIGENQDLVQWLVRFVGELALKIGAVKLAAELLGELTGAGGIFGPLAAGFLIVMLVVDQVKTAVETAGDAMDSFIYNLNPAIKGAINGLVDLVNGAIGAMETAINGAIDLLNRLSLRFGGAFDMGTKYSGFQLSPVVLPRIPGLAEGAVLPANKPFLALLGDQTSGTNVEAPLETIQAAVASVMLEGQDKTLELLERILGAVAGIRVGDEVIGRAARRYERRQAMMGGY